MKVLEIDFEEVGMHMEDNSRESNDYYLDLHTGENLLIPNEVWEAVEEGQVDDVLDWQQDFVEGAKAIQNDSQERYRRIPEVYSNEAYRFMVDFVESVKDKNLGEKLAIALDGSGAFRRFKNVLYDYPEEQDRWYKFKQQKLNDEIKGWLGSYDIEPVNKRRVD